MTTIPEWYYDNTENAKEYIDRSIQSISFCFPSDILENVRNKLYTEYIDFIEMNRTPYFLNFNKSFEYDKNTTAIGACNPNVIKLILIDTKEFIKHSSLATIRLAMISALMMLRTKINQLEDLFIELDNILENHTDFMDLNDHEYHNFVEKYHEKERLEYDIGRFIIRCVIFVWSIKHNRLHDYFKKLYHYIHIFKITLYGIVDTERYDWPCPRALFKDEDNLTQHIIKSRLALFAYKSCGLKYIPTYNPYIDTDTDFNEYITDIERDLTKFVDI